MAVYGFAPGGSCERRPRKAERSGPEDILKIDV